MFPLDPLKPGGKFAPVGSEPIRVAARRTEPRWFIEVRKGRGLGIFVVSYGPYAKPPPDADVKRAREMFPRRKVRVVER